MTGQINRLAAAALLLFACGAALPARVGDDQARDRRWKDLQGAIFGARPLQDGAAMLKLQAPARADDAALVPIGIVAIGPSPLKGLYLVIDDNPSPLAAHFSFGPGADPRELHLRVRVDQYTNVHAVAETQDGRLYAVQQFVKAAGGCSAPAGSSEAAALRGIGQMKLRELDGFSPGKTLQAQLLIRHPNFNGMQMNQLTRLYTTARFINSVDVTYGGVRVFHLDSDISMSTDPAITFGFVPKDRGTLDVIAKDSSGAVFSHSFAVPVEGS